MSYIFIQIPAVQKNDPKTHRLKANTVCGTAYVTKCGAACREAETNCTVCLPGCQQTLQQFPLFPVVTIAEQLVLS